MVEATLSPGGGGIMDMALAARGDFLVVSVLEPSGRATAAGVVFAEGAGTLALVGADLAAVVTVLEVAFEETVFLTGSGLGATGFFLAGIAFLAATGFLTTTGFLEAMAFLAGTAFLVTGFLAITFFATTFFVTTFLATGFFTEGFFVTAFLTTTAFFVGVVFFAATVFFTAGFLALLLLECFVDFNANLPTGWRRVR
jgi:hypothetical protein